MRASPLVAALFVAACVTSGEAPVDAGPDAPCNAYSTVRCVPEAPADAAAPDAAPPPIPCGDDAGAWLADPCDRWTACVAQDGGLPWAVTYAGFCGADGLCHFATTPVDAQGCVLGCWNPGPYGHCGHAGSTGP